MGFPGHDDACKLKLVQYEERGGSERTGFIISQARKKQMIEAERNLARGGEGSAWSGKIQTVEGFWPQGE